MVSIVIALAMIVPGVILTQQFRADSTMQSGPTTYAWVTFDAPGQSNVIREIGTEIVSLRENGAYVKVTEGQRNYLSQHFEMNDMPQRTMVNLAEQGISFDSRVGYELAAEWRNPGTSEYLVQFVAPTETAWNEGVKALAGKILLEIGDNLIVVKMNENQKANVEKLDYVQWVGAYEPGFKMDKSIPSTGTVKITVYAYDISNVPALIDTLRGFGATEIVDSNYGSIDCYISASALPAVARLDTVKQVWTLPEMIAMNNVGGRISQAHDLWDREVTNLPFDLTGAGQTLHVQDTGLDATHMDFTSGALGNRIVYRESATDPDYHGTHCMGTAAGNGYDMEVYLGTDPMNRIYNEIGTNPIGRPDVISFAGRAPETFITANAGFATNEWAAAYDTYGARAFSNSWGPSTINNAYAAAADTAMIARPNGLVLFAAGNDGPGVNTVSGNGNGKLAIAVGATENMRAIDFDSSDDYNQMASFSSRGPVADGRVKPDVVEIGTAVYSTLSDDSAAENTGYELYSVAPGELINTDTSDALGDYMSLQGTSMACPAATGDVTLIRDYLVDVQGYANTGGTGEPHANLLKTLLIHGAEDMGLGYPSFDQGWGRVNVRNSVAPAFPNVLQFKHSTGIASGSWNARTTGGMTTWVIDNTVPLKVTMVHWDTATAGTLTYDLDLVVTSPSGVRYEGNAFKEAWSTPIANAAAWSTCAFPSWMGGAAYDWDTDGTGGDDYNNVEIFRVKTPEKGQWNIEVVWKSSTALPFSVAITGGFNASADVNYAHYTNRVDLLLDTPRVVPENDAYGEATFKAAPDGSVIVPYWINNGGSVDDSYTMSTPILPSGFSVTFYPTSPTAVKANKRVHGYARIMVGSAVAAGTYTLAFKALSNGDAVEPIAQALIKFQIDVVTTKTPTIITVASSPAHEAAPSFVSWTDGGVNYIGCAYTQDDRYGDKVYFKLSSDGGATWGAAVPVSAASWTPGYVTITRAGTGTYAGRLMIAYNAWNPAGVAGNTADTRCSYIKIHTSTNNGATWSTAVDAFALGEGPAATTGANTYRTINVNYIPAVGQFYLTVEVFGYSGTDLNTATQTLIACIGKSSTTGGASWNAWVRIDPAVAGMYYFFPSTEIDATGNMVLFFYERDSGDAAQDRDATFKYYNGAWSGMFSVWDTTDNLMMPQTATSNQGVNGNRAYGAYLKGANTDGDREFYLTYTDNPAAATPTFTTNLGPFGPIMSDHDYGTRFVFDLVWSSPYMFGFGHRNMKYDPYGQPNMLAIYDDDYTGGTATKIEYMTLDSYVHGKQRATATIHGGVAKVFLAQNVMTKTSNHDIIGMHVYNGWQSAVDTVGPITEYVSADKTICNAGDLVTVVANVQEWQTGGNLIRGAQYKTSVSNVTWVNMQSFDGAFNSPAEAVQSTTTKINTAGWPSGWHWIFVRGQDNSAAQNWGAEVGIQIYVNPQVPATATVIGPSGSSNVAGVTITYDWEGIPTSVNLYRTTQTAAPYTWTLIGNDATVDGSYAYTFPAQGNYGLVASAVGGATTETSPPANTVPPEVRYNYDTTAPAAPTLNEVDNWGLTSTSAMTTEVRYMRGVANEAVVNGLTTFSLGTAQSATQQGVARTQTGGTGQTVVWGMRAWKRTSAGVETELTGGSMTATVSRTANAAGIQSATWNFPGTSLATTDSIVIRVYDQIGAGTVTQRAEVTTAQLGATELNAGTWTVYYYTVRTTGGAGGNAWTGATFNWGTTTYDSRVENFQYTTTVARDPKQDNTLNWTASTSPDVDHYNVYRSPTEGGTYTLIDAVPVGTNTYLDLLMGTADPTLYWYHVTAVDMAGNEGTFNANVQELGGVVTPDPYEIGLTGKTAGSWVFVSFPSGLTGNIDIILTDAIAAGGDGLTTWDVAKWYNPQTPADPWKTYRVSGTANDMPTISNGMGFWIHLTANGGDQMLTLSSYVATPASTVINLYAGWNLVGYPSATGTTGATLPAAVDVLSVYSGSGTYTDYPGAAMDSIAITHGNAYFVHCSVDTVWTVTNP